jgi:magnesium transporter
MLRQANAIDFWRGFALVTIFLNHIPGLYYSQFTHANISISDSADLFVFLAGWSLRYLVMSVKDRPTWFLVLRLLGRAAQIYAAQILITMLAIAMLATAATLLEACEFFVLHKFFAFPVVDEERHILGLIDIGVFTEEVFDIAEREQHEDVFETIGFHVAQVREAGPLKAFRYRFPWLLVSIGSGTACAVVASFFAATLAQSLVIAFFLSLVLQLGESVSMQSMTVTIQALRSTRPTLRWYGGTLRRELSTAFLLGAGCAAIVTFIVWLWWRAALPSVVIGSSVLASLVMAGLLGLSVPASLHALRLDPRIAAGPVTLAVTDVMTLFFYFSIASLLLRPA